MYKQVVQKAREEWETELKTYERRGGGTINRMCLESAWTALKALDPTVERPNLKRKFLCISNVEEETAHLTFQGKAIAVPRSSLGHLRHSLDKWERTVLAENVRLANPATFPTGDPRTWDSNMWQFSNEWLALGGDVGALIKHWPRDDALLPIFRETMKTSRYEYGQTLVNKFKSWPVYYRFVVDEYAVQHKGSSSFFTCLDIKNLADFEVWRPIVDQVCSRKQFLFKYLLAYPLEDREEFFSEIFLWALDTKTPTETDILRNLKEAREYCGTTLANLVVLGVLSPPPKNVRVWDHYSPKIESIDQS